MSFGQELGANAESLVGITKKAILVIQRKETDGGGKKTGSSGIKDKMDKVQKISKEKLKKMGFGNDVKGKAEAAVSDIEAMSQAEAADKKAKGKKAGDPLTGLQLVVQYNPSTLGIRGNSIPLATNPLQQNPFGGCGPQAVYQPSILMTVELVFDAMNPQDCFMMDKGGVSVGSAVSGVADIKKSFQGGYSVRPQTDGLLSILAEPETQRVTFCWDEMSFSGTVSEAQAAYTMFNPAGEPVRSTVTLMINQTMGTKTEVNRVYRALVKATEQGGRDVGNAASNLLNLNSYK